jgi:hypothetical protein
MSRKPRKTKTSLISSDEGLGRLLRTVLVDNAVIDAGADDGSGEVWKPAGPSPPPALPNTLEAIKDALVKIYGPQRPPARSVAEMRAAVAKRLDVKIESLGQRTFEEALSDLHWTRPRGKSAT